MFIKICQILYRVLVALNISTITFSGIWLTIMAFNKGELTLFNLKGPFLIFCLLLWNLINKLEIQFLSNDFGKSIILFILSPYYQSCYKELQFSYLISQFYSYLFLFYSLCFMISYIGRLWTPRKFIKLKEESNPDD